MILTMVAMLSMTTAFAEGENGLWQRFTTHSLQS